MSSIEQIYNRLIADEKMKNGSKYERLAAVVYKILDDSDTVIHDLRLRGDGKLAQHQIDVTIEKGGKSKRILVECKEYDKVIGIGIIRDFFGAVAQIKPDEAIVVTTMGYTRGARNFAKDEKINLAILRQAEDSDWEGLIRSIVINGTIIVNNTPSISWLAYDQDELIRVQELLKDHWGETHGVDTQENFFYDQSYNVIANYQHLIKPVINSAPRDLTKPTIGRHEFDNKMYIKMFDQFVAIKGFDYEFTSHANQFQSIVDDGGKVAALLFKILDSDEKMLLFEEDIEKWSFDDNGEVIPKDEQ
jgi:hypothetical protein